jgi:hypothetical protein
MSRCFISFVAPTIDCVQENYSCEGYNYDDEDYFGYETCQRAGNLP